MIPFLAASLTVQLVLLAGIALLHGGAVRERAVEVKILPLRSPARVSASEAAPPPPPPAQVVRALRRSAEKAHVAPLVPVVRDERLRPPPESRPDSPSEADAQGREPGGAPGGAEGGVVGGTPGGVVGGMGTAGTSGAGALAPAAPLPARPRDMDAVRERIARTLRYPPRAKGLGWEGRCLVEFVLLADGAIRHLRVVESSGRPLLDDAALAAVQRGAPFPPPGVDVLVRTPIAFRLH